MSKCAFRLFDGNRMSEDPFQARLSRQCTTSPMSTLAILSETLVYEPEDRGRCTKSDCISTPASCPQVVNMQALVSTRLWQMREILDVARRGASLKRKIKISWRIVILRLHYFSLITTFAGTRKGQAQLTSLIGQSSLSGCRPPETLADMWTA